MSTTAKLKIRSKIYPPNKKQKDVGILAKASVRIYVGDTALVEIKDVTLWKTKDGKIFPKLPNIRYKDGNGDDKTYYYVWIAPDEDMDVDDGLRERFNSSVLNAYKKARSKGREPDEDRTFDDDDEPRKPKKSSRHDDYDDDDDDEPRREPRKPKKNRDEEFDTDDGDENDWV